MKKSSSVLGRIVSAIAIVIIVIVVVAVIFGSNNSSSNKDKSSSTDVTASATDEKNPVIYGDDFFDIEYMKVYDVDGVSTSYIQLKVTNKSDQKVTLLLDDVYVNDIYVTSGTALPIELEPGKISTTPFILFTGNTGLKAEDITKIEFALKGLNDDLKAAHVTDKIILTIGEEISAEIVPATETSDTVPTNEE